MMLNATFSEETWPGAYAAVAVVSVHHSVLCVRVSSTNTFVAADGQPRENRACFIGRNLDRDWCVRVDYACCCCVVCSHAVHAIAMPLTPPPPAQASRGVS
jgi:hypothetical protein